MTAKLISLESISYKIGSQWIPSLAGSINKVNTKLDYSNIVLITGSPRSGTTWLAEVMSAATQFPILWEPLFPTVSNSHLHQKNSLERIFLSAFEEEQLQSDLFDYFDKAFKGQILNHVTSTRCPLSKAILPRGWVAKFCLATTLVPWINTYFPTISPVVIVRHPCAVIASQLKWGWWDKWKKIDSKRIQLELSEQIPSYLLDSFLKSCKDMASYEELLAIIWCLDNAHILQLGTSKRNLIIPYEKITIDGEGSILEILKHVGQYHPRLESLELQHYLSRSSSTTNCQSSFKKGNRRLGRWRNELNDEKVKRIMRVVENFGIDIYSADSDQPVISSLLTASHKCS